MKDIWSTVATERGVLADQLSGVAADQWETPSLCAGWTVRDVVAHQTATASLTPLRFLRRFAGQGFNFGAFAEAEIQRHRGDSPAETLERFRAVQHSTSAPPGPRTSWLGETIVHSEDVRRPLGLAHEYPPEAVRAVIDFYRGSDTLIGSKSRIAGLRLTATDQDWTYGEGPEVTGRLIDLLLAATGRRAGCDDLTGDGVATLRSRCG